MSASFKENFSCFTVHEIFAKDEYEKVNEKISTHFGQPMIYEITSLNTKLSRETNRISETKFVWKVSDIEKFLDNIVSATKKTDQKYDLDLNAVIELIYVVGMTCKELPYYQLVIYVQFKTPNKVNSIIYSYDLAIPFQIFFEEFDGLSNKVYHMSKRKPRYYSHHVIESQKELNEGMNAVQNMISKMRENVHITQEPSDYSEVIRKLPLIQDFVIPTLLSVVSPAGNILPLSSHVEQYSGGGVLQSFTISLSSTPQVFVPNFSKQGIEKEIRMFSPNINVISDTFGGINLHLFLSGLTTWISYCDITVNEIVESLEKIRDSIQNLLNKKKESELKTHISEISRIQGSLASMAMLVENTKFHIMELVDEIANNTGIFGSSELPIPARKDMLFFDSTLRTGVGNLGHLQNIAVNVRNRFNALSKKLETADNPVNKMNNFIYNVANYSLQKTILSHSKAVKYLTISIGVLTFLLVLEGLFHL